MGGSSSSLIRLRTGNIDAQHDKTRVKPAGTWEAHPHPHSHHDEKDEKQGSSSSVRNLYLITFTPPISQQAKERVTELIAPVTLEHYIPDNTFLVYITHQQAVSVATAAAVAAESGPSGIVAVIPLANTHRVQPNVAKQCDKQPGNTACLVVLLASATPRRTDEESTERAAELQILLQHIDPETTVTSSSHNQLQVNTNKKHVSAISARLSDVPDVQWVEAAPVYQLHPKPTLKL